MIADALPTLVRYHIRVNELILEKGAELTEEEFRGEATTDSGSAYETLLHMLVVDWSWHEFCIGKR